MANHDDKNDEHEESSPLLGNQLGEEDAKKAGKPTDAKSDGTVEKAPAPVPVNFGGYGWTADGLPLGHGSVVGEPMGRTHWDSSLFACFGRSDEFCSSDLEVCESFRVFLFYFIIFSYDWDFGILWVLGISSDIFSFFLCLGFGFGIFCFCWVLVLKHWIKDKLSLRYQICCFNSRCDRIWIYVRLFIGVECLIRDFCLLIYMFWLRSVSCIMLFSIRTLMKDRFLYFFKSTGVEILWLILSMKFVRKIAMNENL